MIEILTPETHFNVGDHYWPSNAMYQEAARYQLLLGRKTLTNLCRN